ncbi:MAG: phage terminase small subunit P27 family [Clostridia bacterium]
MAKRGRKPKPTALKKLEGNPGKRPLGELEPLPPISVLRCPNWLLPEARKEWRRLAPALIAMGVLSLADAVPFAAYCTAYARWREAEDEITQHGSVYKDANGNIKPNPYIAISARQLSEIKSLAAEFGLTPATRTAIIANALSVVNRTQDPLEQILTSESLDDVIVADAESNFMEEEKIMDDETES